MYVCVWMVKRVIEWMPRVVQPQQIHFTAGNQMEREGVDTAREIDHNDRGCQKRIKQRTDMEKCESSSMLAVISRR